ncbi:oxidoreductase [Xylariaceae sp. FL1019]|nr:oxidoreductase [Xylariaceae sp. FL1019]
MSPPEILIVGCGIAGPALASFLLLSDLPAAQKPHITILERSSTKKAHLRGQNIDIRGVGVTLIRKLGIEKAIRNSLTGEAGVQLVDEKNRVWTQSRADTTGKTQTPTSDLEILRGKLAEICWRGSQAVSARAEKEGVRGIEYIFGDRLEEIWQDKDKVHVKFSNSGETKSYDILVGADGLQSATRKMVWGEAGESERVKRLDQYGGFFSIPRGETDSEWRRWFHTSGRRGIMVRPDGTGKRSTIFMSVVNDTDPRFAEVAKLGIKGVDAQKQLLEAYFTGAGWECERILREMKRTDDFYYDMIAQVKMDSWSKGRVVLLGDAGYCASPISGLGTTLAFSSAYTLAGELSKCFKAGSLDPSPAFAEYGTKVRPVVDQAQKLAPGMPWLINPETAWGVHFMHTLVYLLSFTRILILIVLFFGKILKRGPGMADYVAVEDYGIHNMSEVDVGTQDE